MLTRVFPLFASRARMAPLRVSAGEFDAYIEGILRDALREQVGIGRWFLLLADLHPAILYAEDEDTAPFVCTTEAMTCRTVAQRELAKMCEAAQKDSDTEGEGG